MSSKGRAVAALIAAQAAVGEALAELGGVPAQSEADRQAALYADLVGRLPQYNGEPYPIALRHPDLAKCSDMQMHIRSDVWAATVWQIPAADRVSWWGDLIRADGGNGMYATMQQHAAWPHRVAESSVIGPG